MAGRESRRSRRAPSPLNRALEPGSQDDLRGPSPTSPSSPSSADESPSPDTPIPSKDNAVRAPRTQQQPSSSSSSSKRARARDVVADALTGEGLDVEFDECDGRELERFVTLHESPLAVAMHLREFVGFSGSVSFVERYGVDLVNWAIKEIAGRRKDFRNPAGFLRHLVMEEAVERREGGEGRG